MTTLSTGNVIIELFSQMQHLLNNYTQEGYQALSNALAAPLGVAISLYIVLMGVSISQGWVEMSMRNFVKASLKVAVIYTAAMNWSWVNEYFIQLVNSVIDTVSNVMISVGDGDITSSLHGGVSQGMQTAFNRVLDLAEAYAKHGSVTNWTPYVESLLLFIVGGFVVGIACAEILIATALIAVLFAFTPLMVAFALFAPTNSFFEKWLGSITGEGMAVILVSAMAGVALVIMGWVFPSEAPTGDLTLITFAAPVIVSFVAILLLLKSASIGRAIGGGVSAPSGLGAAMLAGGAAVWAAKKAKEALLGHKDSAGNKRDGILQKGQQATRFIKSRIRSSNSENDETGQ